MDRRRFIKGIAAAGVAAGLGNTAFGEGTVDRPAAAAPAGTRQPVERRAYGKTAEKLSVIGFGGIIVKDVTTEQAASYVSQAIDRGINYFDVAPSYGNAETMLGPALAPHRDNVFLACKTLERTADGARREMENSFKLLHTDHFELYQFHALTKVEDVEQIFAPGGAMETVLKAREEGKIRYIGFSAHDEQAAHLMLDKFAFDSILFPINFAMWHKGEFGPSVHARAKELGIGILALKAMAHEKYAAGKKREEREWAKCWYEPLDTREQARMGLRFTLHRPVTAMVPPGHWELFSMAVDLAQSGALTPLSGEEEEAVRRLAMESYPIFTAHA